MSKYVLAKDLPFAKAGADVWIDDTWTAWVDGNIYFPTAGVCEFRKGKIMLGKVSNLKTKGWIEEVKPREWEVQEYNGLITSGLISCQIGEQDKIKLIKVREVL